MALATPPERRRLVGPSEVDPNFGHEIRDISIFEKTSVLHSSWKMHFVEPKIMRIMRIMEVWFR